MSVAAPASVLLPGGAAPPAPHAVLGPAAGDTEVDVHLVLRSRVWSRGLGWVNRQAAGPPAHRHLLDRPALAAHFGAAPHEADAVVEWLTAAGLEAVHAEPARRAVRARGGIGAVERAFGVRLERHGTAGDEHLGRRDAVTVPERLVEVVRAVAGLDGCNGLQPLLRTEALDTGAKRRPWSARRVATELGLESGMSGEGVRVALLSPEGGLDADELSAAFAANGMSHPPELSTVCAGTGRSALPEAAGWRDMLLAQALAVGLVAPAARLVVVTGDGGERGALEVFEALGDDRAACDIAVAGWGSPETAWTRQTMRAVEQTLLGLTALGVTVIAACSADGDAVFPATAPHALAVAATSPGGRGHRGVRSGLFPAPLWRPEAWPDGPGEIALRTVPDARGPASLGLRLTATRGPIAVSGPAVAAACWAGVAAAVRGRVGHPLGQLAPFLVGAAGSGAPAGPAATELAGRLTAAPLPASRPPAEVEARPSRPLPR